MTRLQRKNLRQPDELRPLGRGKLELVELGDVAIGRVSYDPGWRWSIDLKPRVHTESCEIHHIGFVVSGRLRVVMNDGSTIELEPDDAFEVPPGHDAWVVGEEPFVAVDSLGRRYFGVGEDAGGRRALGTMLFIDIVGSTEVAARLGDSAWHGLLGELNSASRGELERHRGREVDTTGDGLLAVFDSPTRSVLCALALVAAARNLGLAIRAGVHTGEYEQVGADIRGLAVHVTARVMATAAAGEVRVSAATASLLDPSEFVLGSLGAHELKGVPKAVELLSVERAKPTPESPH
jgi:class 3 adenylate cyclase